MNDLPDIKFSKVLARFYPIWFRDCYDSADYCLYNNWHEKAKYYRNEAKKYFDLINTYWNAIEFFSADDNAFKIDSALPKEFRGYK